MNHCVRLVAYFRQPSARKKYSWNAVFMANDLWQRYNFKYDTQEEYIYYKIASIKPTCNTIAVFDNRPGAPGIIMNKWSYGKWHFMDYKTIRNNLR